MALIEHHFGETSIDEVSQAPSAPSSFDGGMVAFSLLSSRRLIVATTILGSLFGFVSGAIQPNMFRSNGKLLVRPGLREATTPETAARGARPEQYGLQQAVATEMQLLNNPRIFDAVVTEIGPARILTVPDPTNTDTEQTPVALRTLHNFQKWWFQAGSPMPAGEDSNASSITARKIIQASLRLAPAAGSTVIDVFCTFPDKSTAKQIVDAYMKASTEHHQEVFNIKSEYEFLKKQELAAWRERKEANAKLTEFKNKHGIYDLELQKSELIQEIRGLERKIQDTKDERKQLTGRINFIRKTLDDARTSPESSQQQIDPNYLRIQSELLALTGRQLDLRIGDSETQANFELRSKRLAAMIEKFESELSQLPKTRSQNPRITSLVSRLDASMEQLAGLENIQELVERGKSNKKALDQLLGLESDYASLKLAATRTDRSTTSFNAAREQMELMNLLDQQKLGNLQILQVATDPRTRISPSRSRFLAIGILMGLMGGIVLAFTRTLTDSAIRRPSDITRINHRPVLAVCSKRLSKKASHGAMAAAANGESRYQDLIDRLWSCSIATGEPAGQLKIAVTGIESNSGSSTVAAAIAAGLALRTRQKVVLIESHFTSPGTAHLLGINSGPGLSETLHGSATLSDALQSTEIPGLQVLCAGDGPAPNPGTLATDEAKHILDEAALTARYVVLDVAPTQTDPDSRRLLWDADQVVLAVRYGQKKRKLAQQQQVVESAGLSLLGNVLTHYSSVRPFWMPGGDPEIEKG